jgi:branched-chain amino acid aminotransferase
MKNTEMNMKPDLWVNGVFVAWEKACIHPLSHGMQRGATVFESIDCNEAKDGRTAIFRLWDHMIRFKNSAHIIGMILPYDIDSLVQAVVATVARSTLKTCTIRPLAFYAEPVMQICPGNTPVSIVIGLGDAPPSYESFKITFSRFRKIDSLSMPVKAKVSGNYIGPMIAKSEAVRAGFDDIIMLDREGYIAEGSASNVFIVEQGKLITAPDDTILPGITRDSITVIAGMIGIEIIREPFTPERLMRADEVFLCSSGNEIIPIIQVDKSLIAEGRPGQLTQQLRASYSDVIRGCNAELEHWLTYV